jgi:hypothetical protein
MTRNTSIRLAILVIVIVTLACGSSGKTAENTATVVKPTEVVEVQPTEVIDTQATADAEAEMQAATEDAAAAAEEATQAAATAEVEIQATSEADSMYQQVLELEKKGVISSSDGTYTRLEDYTREWAQINWASTNLYDNIAPTNFVIRANVAWEADSPTPNSFNTGCGIAFHATDSGRYFVFLAGDGNVYFENVDTKTYNAFGKAYYGKVSARKDEARVMLAVDRDSMTFYVNEQKIINRTHKAHPTGALGYTLLSGTNHGFGTRCSITNIELWELD